MAKQVVVTTQFRGVFFGTLAEENGDVVVLSEARNVAYWSAGTKGFLGLAKTGPAAGSDVGPAVPTLKLRGVTSIADCTPEAVAAFEVATWK